MFQTPKLNSSRGKVGKINYLNRMFEIKAIFHIYFGFDIRASFISYVIILGGGGVGVSQNDQFLKTLGAKKAYRGWGTGVKSVFF